MEGVPALSPAYPAFSLISFPHPPDPRSQSALPGGKGGILLYFAGGSAPGTPGIRPPAALTEPSKQVPNAEGNCGSAQNRENRLSMSRAGSQGEGGPGEMELSVASDGGV